MVNLETRQFGEVFLTAEGGGRAVVAPLRGGMVASWVARGRERLFLDQASYENASQNVRGGNPVLFPAPGKLVGDVWSDAGVAFTMKQHGFARTEPWEVVEASAASVLLRLVANATTRAPYPFDFMAEMRMTVSASTLRIDQRVENRGTTPMPFGYGFHPYFAVAQSEKAAATVTTGATRAFDNVKKKEMPLAASRHHAADVATAIGVDLELARDEVDLHLLDHGAPTSTLAFASGSITVSASPEYSHWVIWTLRDRDFVCLEPWTCRGDALNTKERLITLSPGASASLWVSFDAA